MAQRRRLAGEELLVALQGGLGGTAVHTDDGVDLGDPDVPVAKGPRTRRQVTQRTPPAHLAARLASRKVATRGDPGRRVAGAVGCPGSRGIEGGHGPGHDSAEAGELALQGLDRLGVGETSRVRSGQAIDHLGQNVKFHKAIEAFGCNAEAGLAGTRATTALGRPFAPVRA